MVKKRPSYPRKKQHANLRWGRIFFVLALLLGAGVGLSYYISSEETPAPAKPNLTPQIVNGRRVLPGETVTPDEPRQPIDPHLAEALDARQKQGQNATGAGPTTATEPVLSKPQPQGQPTQSPTSQPSRQPHKPLQQLTAEMATHRFVGKAPQEWGEHLAGVTQYLSHAWAKHKVPLEQRHGAVPQKTATAAKGGSKTLALTLDACGGRNGSGYDAGLIEFLQTHQIPATLFVTSSWLKNNPVIATQLAQNPLFEIAAHGTSHKPASIEGREAYGIRGTRSLAELIKEVEGNARDIEALTGKKPRWYRSGTAYYDDIAVAVIRQLGYGIAGFSIAADQGATLPAKQVASLVLTAQDGDILLLHMNKPNSGTREGLMQALPRLQEQGFVFVRLTR